MWSQARQITGLESTICKIIVILIFIDKMVNKQDHYLLNNMGIPNGSLLLLS
jgi:hypothetical protein